MISIDQYFGAYTPQHKDVTPAVYANAQRLLTACNRMELIAIKDGVLFPANPFTHNGISGSGNGGFRPQDCEIGAPKSAHKEGLAVDRYDPFGLIDKWLNESPIAAKAIRDLDMYFEAQSATIGWSHWSLKRPPSSKRFFHP